MNENIEKISFYCDCSICKGCYHDFTNSYESNAVTLEHMDSGNHKDKNIQKYEKI
jgi:hypothetical protein